MKSAVVVSLLAMSSVTLPALAQKDGHDTHHGAAVAPADAMTEGEVRKVDKDAQKITLKHGHIANLDMPPMTMVFRVTDSSLLDQVKAGDKVRFVVDRVNGQMTVMRIEKRAP